MVEKYQTLDSVRFPHIGKMLSWVYSVLKLTLILFDQIVLFILVQSVRPATRT